MTSKINTCSLANMNHVRKITLSLVWWKGLVVLMLINKSFINVCELLAISLYAATLRWLALEFLSKSICIIVFSWISRVDRKLLVAPTSCLSDTWFKDCLKKKNVYTTTTAVLKTHFVKVNTLNRIVTLSSTWMYHDIRF